MENKKDYIVQWHSGKWSDSLFCHYFKKFSRRGKKPSSIQALSLPRHLGRLLSGGAMMGAMMKGEKDLLTLQIQCSGPVQGLTVTADAFGHVKGLCQ